MKPHVSVITPVFNARDTLHRAVNSVAAQDFADWEMILSDDGSTDGSIQLAEGLAATEPRIRVLKLAQNQGAAVARNRAIAAARGRFVAFLDADDEWLPNKLRLQLDFMQNKGVPFSYTGFYRAHDGQRREISVPPSVTYQSLLHQNVIGCLTAIYDRDYFGDVRMPDVRKRQDFGMWLKLLRRVNEARGLTEPLAIHHAQSGSLSANRLKGAYATWRLYRDVEELTVPQASRALSSHLFGRFKALGGLR